MESPTHLANAIERANYIAWTNRELEHGELMAGDHFDISFAAYVEDMKYTPGAEYLEIFVKESPRHKALRLE